MWKWTRFRMKRAAGMKLSCVREKKMVCDKAWAKTEEGEKLLAKQQQASKWWYALLKSDMQKVYFDLRTREGRVLVHPPDKKNE